MSSNTDNIGMYLNEDGSKKIKNVYHRGFSYPLNEEELMTSLYPKEKKNMETEEIIYNEYPDVLINNTKKSNKLSFTVKNNSDKKIKIIIY